MKIEDVRLMASGGRLIVPSHVGYPVQVVSETGHKLMCSANGESQRQAVANAMLIAHWANHFDRLRGELDNLIGWAEDAIRSGGKNMPMSGVLLASRELSESGNVAEAQDGMWGVEGGSK